MIPSLLAENIFPSLLPFCAVRPGLRPRLHRFHCCYRCLHAHSSKYTNWRANYGAHDLTQLHQPGAGGLGLSSSPFFSPNMARFSANDLCACSSRQARAGRRAQRHSKRIQACVSRCIAQRVRRELHAWMNGALPDRSRLVPAGGCPWRRHPPPSPHPRLHHPLPLSVAPTAHIHAHQHVPPRSRERARARARAREGEARTRGRGRGRECMREVERGCVCKRARERERERERMPRPTRMLSKSVMGTSGSWKTLVHEAWMQRRVLQGPVHQADWSTCRPVTRGQPRRCLSKIRHDDRARAFLRTRARGWSRP